MKNKKEQPINKIKKRSINLKKIIILGISTILFTSCVPISPTGGEVHASSISSSYLQVKNQRVGDDVVIVPAVRSNGPGWVVIHSVTAGVPAAIIGYSHVSDGLSSNVRVVIDIGQATNTLMVVLYQDEGILGKFEFPGKDEPVMIDNRLVSEAFVISNAVNQSDFF